MPAILVGPRFKPIAARRGLVSIVAGRAAVVAVEILGRTTFAGAGRFTVTT